MPIVTVDGIEVDFPHQPYDCQIAYMLKVISSLKEGKHALLESPTGTGKTLCLLCASLAWLDGMKTISSDVLSLFPELKQDVHNKKMIDDKVNLLLRSGKTSSTPKIIFASRTHSQLTQAISALKSTVYSNRNIGIVGSRDQMCLLPDVLSLESNWAKIYACRMRVQTKTCDYFRNFDIKRDEILTSLKSEGIADIEDLVSFGKAHRCCPYFMSREMKTDSNLIFMPYNYLLDSKIRTLYNIDLENTAVIFDEAHNIEQVCEDASSVELTSALLAGAIEHVRSVCEVVFDYNKEQELLLDDEQQDTTNPLTDAKQRSKRGPGLINAFDVTQPKESSIESLSIEKMLTLKGQLIELEHLIDELDIPADGLTKEGSFIFDLLGKAGFNEWTIQSVFTIIDELLSFTNSTQNSKVRKAKGLNQVGELLKTVFNYQSDDVKSSFTYQNQFKLLREHSCTYRVHIKNGIVKPTGQFSNNKNVWDAAEEGVTNSKNRVINYWCFSPGRAIQELVKQKVRCIILTSGTLYPIESLESQMNLKFPITLQNPHVINPDQLHLSVIPRGLDGGRLNSSYSSRDTPVYRNSLGYLLVELSQIVPFGLLVFFPSYSFMTQCVDFWKNENIYGEMLKKKPIFIEPRDKDQFIKIFAEYRQTACATSSGAMLLAVMRGRVSEGLDLADNAGRAVAIVGLPYAPFHDARIRLKMAYLDEQHVKQDAKIHHRQTGKQWYNMQAWRAINQSVGRVIRHHLDYGAVFLCDERFASNQAQSNLTSWMQSRRRVYADCKTAMIEVVAFFQSMQSKYPCGSRQLANSKNSSKHLPQSTSLKRSFGIDSTQLAHLPPANKPNIYAYKSWETDDNEAVLFDAYGLDKKSFDANQPVVSNSQLTKPSQSIFDAVYGRNDVENRKNTNHSVSSLNDQNEDRLLEQKLLQNHATKRLRLTAAEPSCSLSSATKSNAPLSNYMSNVKRVFGQISSTGAEAANRLREFKQAAIDYKRDLIDNETARTTHSAVDALFNKLSRIFLPLECPGLLQDAVCFVVPEHCARFAELSENLTGLPILRMSTPGTVIGEVSAKETQLASAKPTVQSGNYSMKCTKCHSDPASVPLVSVCKHIACFSCWRLVIEQEHRRCPGCQKLIRKRDLAKLTTNS